MKFKEDKNGEELGMVPKVIKFFRKNKNPTDTQYHAWADKTGDNIHELEEAAYRLSTIAANLKHGEDPDSDFDPQELKWGIEIEKEHSDDLETKKMIAKAHLAEFPNYYTELKKMEDKMKAMKKSKESLFAEVAKMESEINEKENPIQANPAQPRNPNYDLEFADNIPDDKEPDELMVEIEALERQLEGGPGSGKTGGAGSDGRGPDGETDDTSIQRPPSRIGPDGYPKEAAKPYQAPVKKPKKSDDMESPDGKAIMDEIDRIGKAVDAMGANKDAPIDKMPTPDGTGMDEPEELEECDSNGNPIKKKEEDGDGDSKLDIPKPGTPVKVPIPTPKKPEDPKTESLSFKEYLSKNKEFRHQVPTFMEGGPGSGKKGHRTAEDEPEGKYKGNNSYSADDMKRGAENEASSIAGSINSNPDTMNLPNNEKKKLIIDKMAEESEYAPASADGSEPDMEELSRLADKALED